MIEVLGIPREKVDRFWPAVAPMIERALDYAHGEFLIDDIRLYAKDNRLQLWVVLDEDRLVGAIVTEIANYPRVLALRFLALAGENLDGWMDEAEEFIVSRARDWGCGVSEGYGRRGWERKARHLGYEFGHVMVRKEI